MLTAIIVTSPVASNPSTELVDRLVCSMTRNLRGFEGARLVVVCDGYAIGDQDPSKRNFGIVTEEQAQRYEAFKIALRQQGRPNTQIVELATWTGFALGLKAALEAHVVTPLVLVCPHDYEFNEEVDMASVCSAVLRGEAAQRDLPTVVEMLAEKSCEGCAEESNEEALVSYVGFCAAKQSQAVARHSESCAIKVLGLRLVPLSSWKENPHIASVAAYWRLVYCHDRFRAGEFIEDRLGNVIRSDVKLKGMPYHRRNYGMYHLDTSLSAYSACSEPLEGQGQCQGQAAARPRSTLYHMDGRAYKPVHERVRLGWRVSAEELKRAESAARMVAAYGQNSVTQ